MVNRTEVSVRSLAYLWVGVGGGCVCLDLLLKRCNCFLLSPLLEEDGVIEVNDRGFPGYREKGELNSH